MLISTWALDVADDGTALVVHELDTALGNAAAGAYREVRIPSIFIYSSEWSIPGGFFTHRCGRGLLKRGQLS